VEGTTNEYSTTNRSTKEQQQMLAQRNLPTLKEIQ
jgi:hypothetical protein